MTERPSPSPGGPTTAAASEVGAGAGLKVLVVDDEPAMVGVIGAILGDAGHRIVAAYDGREAIRRFEEEHPDLILLDLAMPGLDGADVCRTIRETSEAPIIIITGESDVDITVELLDAGADDYLRKPFRGEELLARARAVVRRRRRRDPESGWAVDRRRHEIRWRGAPILTTEIELSLLATLVERLGEVVSHAELMAAAWPGVPDPDPLWLKPHLARLRAKLEAAGAPTPAAVRGVGYRLDEPERDPDTRATSEADPSRPAPGGG